MTPTPRAGLIAAVLLLGALFPTGPAAAIPQLPGTSPPAAQEPASAPTEQVEAETSPAEDAAIERRLQQVYSTVEGLEGVGVEVRSGVVTLGGEVLSEAKRQQAIRLARTVRGVVEVEDEIAEVRDLDRRLASALDGLRDTALGLLASLPLAGVALVLFLLFVLLARLIGGWSTPFRRLTPNRFLADLLRHAVQGLVVVLGAVAALEVLDATAVVAAVAGAAGLAGLALGFAFRDLVENYIASVLLSLRQPFLPNDHVVIEGHEGKVVRLTSRATILITLDGNHVRIPNSNVFKGVILNFTRNPRRRFDFVVGVDTSTDLARVQELGLEALAAMDPVLDDPPPQSWIDELGESSVAVHFFGWMDQRGAEWAKVRGEAIRQVKEAFDAARIRMPEPIFNLRMEEVHSLEEPAAGTSPRPAPADSPPRDVSRDTHIDREVAQDRASQTTEETDLLSPEAPVE
ncbi:MAG TPA: mechanosensitive ion channel domain-containing protein [Thermoanaerobaculia bacterium]|nr:mechanosensitive ion channel domain-containing protein [Thermoanaerobaculia bacterium]